MSEAEVKSCRGTYLHFCGVTSCVVFRTPSSILANFVLIYNERCDASVFVSKAPILRKVSVEPTPGSDIIGGVKVSPKAPEPLALEKNILYLYRLLTSLI